MIIILVPSCGIAHDVFTDSGQVLFIPDDMIVVV
jgi:hypothetical protein